MKREDVQAKIDVIIDSLDKLGILKRKPYEDFVSDFRNIDAALISRCALCALPRQAFLAKGKEVR